MGSVMVVYERENPRHPVIDKTARNVRAMHHLNHMIGLKGLMFVNWKHQNKITKMLRMDPPSVAPTTTGSEAYWAKWSGNNKNSTWNNKQIVKIFQHERVTAWRLEWWLTQQQLGGGMSTTTRCAL